MRAIWALFEGGLGGFVMFERGGWSGDIEVLERMMWDEYDTWKTSWRRIDACNELAGKDSMVKGDGTSVKA